MNRFDKRPVRWRLALTSAGLTFVILLLFAILVEVVTVSRIRSNFDNDREMCCFLERRVARTRHGYGLGSAPARIGDCCNGEWSATAGGDANHDVICSGLLSRNFVLA